ncbi:MAG: glycoside hydrolase family 127 protein [Clostridia bacterium]|nr:glycoside hydrolase family 127 protein [Clostridia bacterium]
MLLKDLQFKPFSIDELKPTGWLMRQLRLQADGLSGNLQKIWPDIRDSAWIGGKCDGWERVPYWLDGFIPLAYILEDEALIADADRYVNGIIERIAPDGWVCPCPEDQRGTYDMWAYLLICKVFTVYADCNKAAESKIQTILERALYVLDKHLDQHPLFDWGKARWFEGLIPVYWLYERNHDDAMLELAVKLRTQGSNWEQIMDSEAVRKISPEWGFDTHIVNLNMMLKAGALVSRIDGNDPDAFALSAIETLDKYHGMPTGAFAGDECLAGTDPVQGTELCGIVEAMYSYETMLAISGNPYWADRLERLAFNALPATVSADMWTHQYDQMTNQIECAPFAEGKKPFKTNTPDAHTFGLEPNFGCCTANFNQGWPKLAMSTFMRYDKGIVSTVLAPSSVSTKIGNANVNVTLETDYPFTNKLVYRIKTDSPISFTLKIRIPSFVDGVTIDGKDTFENIKWMSMGSVWNGEHTITIDLNVKTKLRARPNDMVCVERGPLLFALAIEEEWEKIESERNGEKIVYPYCDYYVHPKSEWNYALTSDTFKIKRNKFDIPFTAENPPVELSGEGVLIDWPEEDGKCAVVPNSREPQSEVKKIRFIPYGCARLRITELPYIK